MGKGLVSDNHEPVDIAASAAVALGQRTGHYDGEHLVVIGGGLGPTSDGISMMLLYGPSRNPGMSGATQRFTKPSLSRLRSSSLVLESSSLVLESSSLVLESSSLVLDTWSTG